ncbi:hypothetical protein [Streptomyces sp. NPDC045714]|uniref:hypothetical protein n=1 Tax=Streptomyces sp. NPDC045714 TaxID=3154913 RepID=UPI0034090A5A
MPARWGYARLDLDRVVQGTRRQGIAKPEQVGGGSGEEIAEGHGQDLPERG